MSSVMSNISSLFSPVVFVSVSNNTEFYERFFRKNSFLTYDHIQTHCFNNFNNKFTIPQWYNKFLDEYNYDNESWFVFCHCDWELMEDIRPILANLNKNCIYGPIGAKLEIYNGKAIPSLGHIGSIWEQKRDGSNLREIGNQISEPTIVDTFDCQAIIVHSTLIKKYDIRFDEKLSWDLYVEDFSIFANKNYGIKSYVIPIKCCHHSDASYIDTPISYYKSLEYLNTKYPDDVFQGTVSIIGGKQIEKASAKEIMFYNLRKKIK